MSSIPSSPEIGRVLVDLRSSSFWSCLFRSVNFRHIEFRHNFGSARFTALVLIAALSDRVLWLALNVEYNGPHLQVFEYILGIC